MPPVKNALIRYRVLDRCFSNPVKKYFIEDLVKACDEALREINPKSSGIQKRTIQYDIAHMESAEGYNAVIDRISDGKKIYFRYADRNFSINQNLLNPVEMDKMKAALDVLSRFDGMPQFQWVNELSTVLEQTFLMEKRSAPIISFDNNNYLTGIHRLGELFNFILYEKTLCISYRSFKSEKEIKIIIHPYYLKQYNNRWFLFGLNGKFQKISNLALDRITDIKEDSTIFISNTKYDFNEYFEDIIGVTLMDDQSVEKVILEFHVDLKPYILSKPLHGSQKIIAKENELKVSIEVVLNYELESLLLSFGENVTVLEPLSLQQKMLFRIGEAFTKYQHFE